VDDFNSSELPLGSTTHNEKENIFMTTKISQWRRIALLAAGISTSMVSMAWGQQLYQTHSDGSIWEYSGTPCNGGSCPGWLELDNNPNLSMVATGGGFLYELHKSGSIWWYVGPTCGNGSCPGWVELDNNPSAVAIGTAANGMLFEVHSDGSLWEWNGVICNGGFCPGWKELSNEPAGAAAQYGANASQLYWQYQGALGQEEGVYDNITLFGGKFDTWETTALIFQFFAVGPTYLYGSQGGLLYQYLGPTTGWIFLDNADTLNLAAGGGLYQQRKDNEGNTAMWEYTGTPCNYLANVCPGWAKIDDNPTSGPPVAGADTVYQIRTPAPGQASIWQYTGTPCTDVCSGWIQLDNNGKTKSIVAGPVSFGSPGK
jgi:hypothetical protein